MRLFLRFKEPQPQSYNKSNDALLNFLTKNYCSKIRGLRFRSLDLTKKEAAIFAHVDAEPEPLARRSPTSSVTFEQAKEHWVSRIKQKLAAEKEKEEKVKSHKPHQPRQFAGSSKLHIRSPVPYGKLLTVRPSLLHHRTFGPDGSITLDDRQKRYLTRIERMRALLFARTHRLRAPLPTLISRPKKRPSVTATAAARGTTAISGATAATAAKTPVPAAAAAPPKPKSTAPSVALTETPFEDADGTFFFAPGGSKPSASAATRTGPPLPASQPRALQPFSHLPAQLLPGRTARPETKEKALAKRARYKSPFDRPVEEDADAASTARGAVSFMEEATGRVVPPPPRPAAPCQPPLTSDQEAEVMQLETDAAAAADAHSSSISKAFEEEIADAASDFFGHPESPRRTFGCHPHPTTPTPITDATNTPRPAPESIAPSPPATSTKPAPTPKPQPQPASNKKKAKRAPPPAATLPPAEPDDPDEDAFFVKLHASQPADTASDPSGRPRRRQADPLVSAPTATALLFDQAAGEFAAKNVPVHRPAPPPRPPRPAISRPAGRPASSTRTAPPPAAAGGSSYAPAGAGGKPKNHRPGRRERLAAIRDGVPLPAPTPAPAPQEDEAEAEDPERDWEAGTQHRRPATAPVAGRVAMDKVPEAAAGAAGFFFLPHEMTTPHLSTGMGFGTWTVVVGRMAPFGRFYEESEGAVQGIGCPQIEVSGREDNGLLATMMQECKSAFHQCPDGVWAPCEASEPLCDVWSQVGLDRWGSIFTLCQLEKTRVERQEIFLITTGAGVLLAGRHLQALSMAQRPQFSPLIYLFFVCVVTATIDSAWNTPESTKGQLVHDLIGLTKVMRHEFNTNGKEMAVIKKTLTFTAPQQLHHLHPIETVPQFVQKYLGSLLRFFNRAVAFPSASSPSHVPAAVSAQPALAGNSTRSNGEHGLFGKHCNKATFSSCTDYLLTQFNFGMDDYSSIDVSGYFKPPVDGQYAFRMYNKHRGQLDMDGASCGSLAPSSNPLLCYLSYDSHSFIKSMERKTSYWMRLREQSGCGGGNYQLYVTVPGSDETLFSADLVTPTFITDGDLANTGRSSYAAPSSLVAGNPLAFDVVLRDDDGNTIPPANTITFNNGRWSATAKHVASGNVIGLSIDGSGSSGAHRATSGSTSLTLAGTYEISVKYDGYFIPSSSYQVVVTPAAVSAAQCAPTMPSVSWSAGSVITWPIQPRDAYGNNVDCTANLVSRFAASLKGTEIVTATVACSGSLVQATAIPTKAGVYGASVTFDGISVAGSPTSGGVTITFGSLAASMTTATWPLATVAAGSSVTVTIQARGSSSPGSMADSPSPVFVSPPLQGNDTYGNLVPCSAAPRSASAFAVSMEGPTTASTTGATCSGQDFVIAAAPRLVGTYTTKVTYAGTLIKNSGSTGFAVVAADLDAAHCTVSWPSSGSVGTAGVALSMTITGADQFGNPVACTPSWASTLTGAMTSGATTIAGTSSCQGPAFVMTFRPLAALTYAIAIAKSGTGLPQSPYTNFQVVPGPISAGSCTVDWPATQVAIVAGTAFSMVITARDVQGNLFQCDPTSAATFRATLTGPETVSQSAMCSGTQFVAALQPTKRGAYTLAVDYGQVLIAGAPTLPYTVLPAASSASMSAAQWAVAALQHPVAGQTVAMSLAIRDRFGNDIDCTPGVLSTLATRLVGASSSLDGTVACAGVGYQASWTPTAAASYVMTLRIEGTEIAGSGTVTLAVAPAPMSPSHSSIAWSGATPFVAGSTLSAVLTNRDQYDNLIACSPTLFQHLVATVVDGKGQAGTATLTSACDPQGYHLLSGVLTVAGPTNVTVKYDDIRYGTGGSTSLVVDPASLADHPAFRALSARLWAAPISVPRTTAAWPSTVTASSSPATFLLYPVDSYGNARPCAQGLFTGRLIRSSNGEAAAGSSLTIDCQADGATRASLVATRTLRALTGQAAPTEELRMEIAAAADGAQIASSPRALTVLAAPLSPSHTSLSPLTASVAASTLSVAITARDQFDNEVTCTGALLSQFTTTLTGPQTYTGAFVCTSGVGTVGITTSVTPTASGSYTWATRYAGTDLLAPATLTVQPGALSTSYSSVTWPASLAQGVTAGTTLQFDVFGRDAQQNLVGCVSVNAASFSVDLSPGPAESKIICAGAAYKGVVMPTVAGTNYTVTVRLVGTDLQSGLSPSFAVLPAAVEPLKTTADWPGRLADAPLTSQLVASDQWVNFTLDVRDRFGNVIACSPAQRDRMVLTIANSATSAASPLAGSTLNISCEADQFRVDMQALKSSTAQQWLWVRYRQTNLALDHIAGSPRPLKIIPGDLSPAHSDAGWPQAGAASTLVAGSAVTVLVTGRDRLENEVPCTATLGAGYFAGRASPVQAWHPAGQEGYAQPSMVAANGTFAGCQGTQYLVHFAPINVTGYYQLEATAAGSPLRNAPMDHNLWVKPDAVVAARSTPLWPAEPVLTAGMETEFTILVRDAYDNLVRPRHAPRHRDRPSPRLIWPASCVWDGPSQIGCASAPVGGFHLTMGGGATTAVACSGSLFKATARSTLAGTYSWALEVDGAPVQGSPLAPVRVVPAGLHPSHCSATWPSSPALTSTLTASPQAYPFALHVADQYDNPIACTQAQAALLQVDAFDSQGQEAPNANGQVNCTADGSWQAWLKVTKAQATGWGLVVRTAADGVNITGSPHPLAVLPAALTASQSFVDWTPAGGLHSMPAGETLTVPFEGRDQFGNPVACQLNSTARFFAARLEGNATDGLGCGSALPTGAALAPLAGTVRCGTKAGSYLADFAPLVTGCYRVRILAADPEADLAHSPAVAQVAVRGAALAALRSSVSWPGGPTAPAPTLTAGQAATFALVPRDAYGNHIESQGCDDTAWAAQFQVRVLLPDGSAPALGVVAEAAIKCLIDAGSPAGRLEGTLNVTRQGRYRVEVTYGGLVVAGSPLVTDEMVPGPTRTAHPAPPCHPLRCTTNSWFWDARVSFELDSGVPAALSASHTSVQWPKEAPSTSALLSLVASNAPTLIEARAYDRFMNMVPCTDALAARMLLAVEPPPPGDRWAWAIGCNAAGTFTASLQCNLTLNTSTTVGITFDGAPLAGSPHSLEVTAADFSLAYSRAEVPALGSAILAGDTISFEVHARDQFGNYIPCVAPRAATVLKPSLAPANHSASIASVSGLVGCGSSQTVTLGAAALSVPQLTLTPTIVGTYVLSVPTGTGGLLPLTQSGATEIQVKVHSAAHEADIFGFRSPTAALLCPAARPAAIRIDGLVADWPAEAIATQTGFEFLITGADRYRNPVPCNETALSLFAVSIARAANDSVPVSVGQLSCQGPAIRAVVPVTQAAAYMLRVSYNGEALRGSPRTLTIKAGSVEPQNSTVHVPSAPGKTMPAFAAGSAGSFTMSLLDAFGNAVTCSPETLPAFRVDLIGPTTVHGTVNCTASGQFQGLFRATRTGRYRLNVTYDGQPIGAPAEAAAAVALAIQPGDVAPQKCGVAFDGCAFNGTGGLALDTTQRQVVALLDLVDDYANPIECSDDQLQSWRFCAEAINQTAAANGASLLNCGTFSCVNATAAAGANNAARAPGQLLGTLVMPALGVPQYRVSLQHWGLDVAGSPFPMTVQQPATPLSQGAVTAISVSTSLVFLAGVGTGLLVYGLRRRRNSKMYKQQGSVKSSLVHLNPLTALQRPLPERIPDASWVIDWKELQIVSVIGSGSFAEVYKAQWRGTLVAVKKLLHVASIAPAAQPPAAPSRSTPATPGRTEIQMRPLGQAPAPGATQTAMSPPALSAAPAPAPEPPKKQGPLDYFQDEIDVMSKLRHPNVVQFIGASLEPPFLVLQFMPRGTLQAVRPPIRPSVPCFVSVSPSAHPIHRCFIALTPPRCLVRPSPPRPQILADPAIKLPWNVVKQFAVGAARGILYLHSFQPPIIHRDLKSANLLVDLDWTIKVADFGLARVVNTMKTMTNAGTPAWTAPEVMSAMRYTEKADVYSFAIIMWEMMTRQLPFEDQNPMLIPIRVLTKGERPPIPANPAVPVPSGYVSLMTECWATEPERRPSMEKVLARLEKLK
ncbi:putative protein tyrosine kinase [Paratrimastix pyriformis]|uniref:Protein kinase domain-containing protein n=1 Tax=Paratrimastix pyriformis TaxID=342808 RepID=A0ABQ8UM37_9EUKA|nr:putative protein tyrosine kinase [Paratrimastix pyriformis]